MGSKNTFMNLLKQAERRFCAKSRNLRIKVNGRDEEIPETVPEPSMNDHQKQLTWRVNGKP